MPDKFGQIDAGNEQDSTLTLDKMQVIGRGIREYKMMFNLDEGVFASWKKRKSFRILDVASGTSSFRAEIQKTFAGADCQLEVFAVDPAYKFPSEEVHSKANSVAQGVLEPLMQANTWVGHSWVAPAMPFQTPSEMLEARLKTYQAWANDISNHPELYLEDSLPLLQSLKGQAFDQILCGNCLFAYANSDYFGQNDDEVFEFHRKSLIAMASLLAPAGELLVYPIGTNESSDYKTDELSQSLISEGFVSEVKPVALPPNVKSWENLFSIRRA